MERRKYSKSASLSLTIKPDMSISQAWQNVFTRPVGSCAHHDDSALTFMEKMGTMTRLLKRGCRKLYEKTMHHYLLADPVVMTLH